MSADTGRGGRVVAGRYALTDVLGRGGMGTVWLATDRVLERQVALKEVTFSVDLSDEERHVLRERTMREARAAARLDHPHVTTVYDVVEEDGKPWLVMEHISARSLQEILEERGPLDSRAVARIGLDVLDALDAAHDAGIVHRDVKPANVLVDRDGHACLTDFGIATTTGDSSLTTHGALIGSPSYMAPERANGEEPRPPVDLWSLGATLYAGVEGRPPFDKGEAMATLMSVVSEHPAPMLRAGPLEPVLRGLLTKDPTQRATSPQARRDLQAVLAGPPPGSPPPPRVAAPPPQSPGPVPGGKVERIDSEDFRALASASKALIGSVARDLADRRRDRRADDRSGGKRNAEPLDADRRRGENRGAPSRRPVAPVAEPPRRRRRFKRRWVVVPVLTTVIVVVLLLIGAAVGLAAILGLI
jgi:eukaryotic-like serine/threonine-protein kinase